MYESPINQVVSKILSEMKEYEDDQLMCEVRQTIGYDIDKAELVRALQYDREQYKKGYADGLNADRWIPCGERLPEDYETVIASVDGFIYPEARYSKEDGWEWAYESGADYWKKIEDYVIAWMPLPKPYKESMEV